MKRAKEFLKRVFRGYDSHIEIIVFVEDDKPDNIQIARAFLQESHAYGQTDISRKDIQWDVEAQAFADYYTGTVHVKAGYGYLLVLYNCLIYKIKQFLFV